MTSYNGGLGPVSFSRHRHSQKKATEAVYHRIPFHPSYLPYLTPDTLDPGFS